MQKHIFNIEPMSYVRMTRRSIHTATAKRYHNWKARLQKIMLEQKFYMPESDFKLTFYIPVPDTISKKQKALRVGAPHQVKPDDDNYYKAFKDSYFYKKMLGRRKDILCAGNREDMRDDCVVWHSQIFKYWCERGEERIEIEIY